MSNLLDQLNIQQRAAVEQTEGPLLILAGAGSGKTRVITYRIAYLIEAQGVPPESILAVTFTNKAAAQMKERVAKLLDGRVELRAGAPHVSTFHSFCVSVLRRHIDHLGYSRDFSIYDEDDQQRLMKTCIQELGLGEQVTSPRSVLSRISYAKNHGLTPEVMYQQAENDPVEKIATLFGLYEAKLRQANALDFDDLLLKTVELFYKAAEVCEQYNRRFQYVLVDEYQDTNRTQYQLIRQLTLMHQNLCVVGDEDQSIYRWRGADIQNILSFEKDYPKARTVRLEQNYRSTQKILDAAGAVVSRNLARKGKTLWTDRSGGDGIGLYEAWDNDEEALYVAGEITKALAQDAEQQRGRPVPHQRPVARAGRIPAPQRDCLSPGGRVQFLRARGNPRRAGLRATGDQSARCDGAPAHHQHPGAGNRRFHAWVRSRPRPARRKSPCGKRWRMNWPRGGCRRARSKRWRLSTRS